MFVTPTHSFVSDAASAHAAAHDEQVNRMFFHFGFADATPLVASLTGIIGIIVSPYRTSG